MMQEFLQNTIRERERAEKQGLVLRNKSKNESSFDLFVFHLFIYIFINIRTHRALYMHAHTSEIHKHIMRYNHYDPLIKVWQKHGHTSAYTVYVECAKRKFIERRRGTTAHKYTHALFVYRSHMHTCTHTDNVGTGVLRRKKTY